MNADESPETQDTADLNQDEIPTVGADLEDGLADLPSQIGHFRILRKIGEGGMGAVYEAEQDRPRRRVAIKAIRPESTTPEIIKRFEQELQVLGQLHHPGIAEIYEAGTVDTAQGARPYFAMEYIDGETLTAYSKTHDLTTRQRLALMAKICDAIQHAHQRGVIHRDLKPGNILVVDTETSTDGDRPGSSASMDVDDVGQPKILDFGVARATGLDLQVTLQTNLGQIIGTVPYMSPEQISGDPELVDARSDVYGLGVIAYELLAGHLPYEVWRKPIQEAARIISEEEPSRLQTIDRHYRGDIDTIVRKALEKDRERRYQSAEEMASDVRRYLSEQPILARPPSAVYQLRKFARRNRGLVAGIAAAFLFLAGGATVSTWQAVRATRGERRAEREAETATQVSDFLIDLFEVSDPGQAKGSEISAREILDRGADRVRSQLADQPVVQARMMNTLGRVYLGLGHLEEAERLLESALDIRRAELGDLHPDTLSSLDDLAGVYLSAGDLERAEECYREAVEGHRLVLGDDDPSTLFSVGNLGTLLLYRGDLEQAERYCREAVNGLQKVLDADDPNLIVPMANLAYVYQMQGRFDEAEPYYRESLATARRVLGNDHPDTLNMIGGMSYLLKDQGKLEEAEPYYREALEGRRRVLGDDHPSTLTSLANLGLMLKLQGKYDEAEGCYLEALEARSRILGDDHPETLITIANLGSLQRAQGRYEDAERSLREALEGYRRELGDDHPETINVLNNLGVLLMDMGRLEEAEDVLLRAVEISRRVQGDDHPRTLKAIANLGRVRRDQGQLDEADALFREALEGQRRVLGEQHPATHSTLKRLVELYEAWGQSDMAAEYRALLPDEEKQ